MMAWAAYGGIDGMQLDQRAKTSETGRQFHARVRYPLRSAANAHRFVTLEQQLSRTDLSGPPATPAASCKHHLPSQQRIDARAQAALRHHHN